MLGLDPDRTYQYLTDKQAAKLAVMVEQRYLPDDAGRQVWRDRFQAIRRNSDVSEMIAGLEAIPTLAEVARREAREARAQRPTEDGYYRNPETGELFRISHGVKGHGIIVSKYSLTGGPRRLIASTDEIVKGKWDRLGKFASRQALASIKVDWLTDPKTLAQDFAYGFCPLHHGPLTDGVSVTLGYGPDCAEKHGLPWGEEVAKRVLAARQTTTEEN